MLQLRCPLLKIHVVVLVKVEILFFSFKWETLVINGGAEVKKHGSEKYSLEFMRNKHHRAISR